jgi:two-component system sensor histidine kinase VicK
METNSELTNLEPIEEIASKRTDAVLIVDLIDQKIQFSNGAAFALLGICSGDGYEKFATLLDSVATGDRDYVKEKYFEVRKLPKVSGIEFRLLKRGKATWLSCETVTFNDQRYVYVIVRDVSKLKEQENYFVEYTTRKNTLLDTLVHQLSGALSLTKNLASKATNLAGTSDQESLETLISLIYNNSKHCIKIIDDLIKKETADTPDAFIKLQRIDVVKHVSYIFDELKRTDHRHFVFETNAPAVYISTDDMKLLQVVNNLASNAMKFTRPGDEIRFSVEETASSVIISISDTGVGIPKLLQPFLFEKHGPAGRTGLNGEKSNGLGLSIARNTTLLLGGQLTFQSEDGKGSTFRVELRKDQ